MISNPVAIYLGCAGLLVGAVGLAIQATSRDGGSAEPASARANIEPVQSNAREAWPPEPSTGSVAYVHEMIRLLTPTESKAVETQNAPAAPAEDPSLKERAREVKAEKPRVRASRSARRERERNRRDLETPEPERPQDARAQARSGSVRYRVERVPPQQSGDGFEAFEPPRFRIFGPFEDGR